MLRPQGILTPPQVVTITYDGTSSQTSLLATWAEEQVFSGQHRAWSWIDEDGEATGGQWWPLFRTRAKTGPSNYSQTVRWGKAPTWEQIASLVATPSWLRAQLSRLSSGAWISLFNQILLQAEPDRQGAASAADSGQLLAELLLADFPHSAESLDDYTRVLSEYQLGIDPTTLFPISLLDLTNVSEAKPISPAEWSEEATFIDNTERPISCQFYTGGAPLGTVILGSDTTLPTLRVKDPANSEAEAYLEIMLQRLRLLSADPKASAVIPLDLSLNPGAAVSYEGQDWIILKSIHRLTATSRVDTTNLTLRASSSAPSLPSALSPTPPLEFPPFGT